MSETTPKHLVDRDTVLQRLYDRALTYAARRIDPESAKDVAQETLMVLRRKYADLKREEDLTRVTTTIVKNQVLSHWRDQGRKKTEPISDMPMIDRSPSPEIVAYHKQRLALCVNVRETLSYFEIREEGDGRNSDEGIATRRAIDSATIGL